MAGLKIDGKTLQQRILEFRNRPDVDEFVRKNGVVLNNAQIQKEFRNMIRMYSEKTKIEMLKNVPNLFERQSLVNAREAAEGLGEVEQVRAIDEQIDELILRARRGY